MRAAAFRIRRGQCGFYPHSLTPLVARPLLFRPALFSRPSTAISARTAEWIEARKAPLDLLLIDEARKTPTDK